MSEATTIPKSSRVGKKPVAVPNGVTAEVKDGELRVKGPKGELKRQIPSGLKVQVEGSNVEVHLLSDGHPKFQGLFRALAQNMVKGANEGFGKSLDLYGVGYRAEAKGRMLTLSLGLSHTVSYELPEAVSAKIETIDEAGTKRPRIHLSSIDNEALGRAAARIRSFRPPEPYKGKGVRYVGERIREKAGKAGKAKK